MEKTSQNQAENEIYQWNEDNENTNGNFVQPKQMEIQKRKKKNDKEDSDDNDELYEESNVKYYEWNEQMLEHAKNIINEEGDNQLPNEQVQKLENYQRLHWDVFYKNNKDHFYKDRHYIKYEFTELAEVIQKKSLEESNIEKIYTLLDYGCGVGNGFFPLVQEFGFQKLRINCCDISKTAISIIKNHNLYSQEYINAIQADLVNDQIPFPNESADFSLLLFVLSAISPDKYNQVIKKLSDQIKTNGIVFFRDYGRYDMAQLRFSKRGNQKLGENFYVRHDKTRAYYFTLEEVAELFEKNGFKIIENKYFYRMIENRKEQKRMYRVWIQSKFIKI